MKNTRLIIFFVLIACIFPFSGNAASRYYWQKQCRKLMEENPAKITISYNLGKLQYDNSLSPEQIKELSAKSTALPKETTYMGLTLLNLYNNIKAAII